MLELRVYKNWKELCEEVGWNPNNRGTYKQARLKELDTICNWHKDGNKIVIDEVFGELSEENDKRINNGGNSTKSAKEDDKRANNKNQGHSTSKYEMVDTLIYNQLSNIERIFTKSQLIRNAGLYISKDNIINSCNVESEYSIDDFLDVFNSTINKLIDTSLNRMSKNKIIKYGKVIVIDSSVSVVSLNSKVCKIIENIENEVSKDMNVKNIYLLPSEEKKAFYDRCNEKAIEMGVCQEYYYRAFSIKKIDDIKNYNNNAKQEFFDKVCKSVKKSKTFKNKIEDAQNKFIKQKEILTNDDCWGDSIYDTFGEEVILENLSKVVCNRLSKNYSSDINSIISFIVKQGD